MIYFGLADIGSSSARSKLEDDEIDAEMYIQPGNPHFIAKYIHSRPNELVQFFLSITYFDMEA
jgi:hypothetical protein